jgi:hypothetical protein
MKIRRPGRAPRSWAAPQAAKASSRRRDFRSFCVGLALFALDRPHALRPGNRGTAPPPPRLRRTAGAGREGGRRFPCTRSTACYEGPLAMHPVPVGSIPDRGLLSSPTRRPRSVARPQGHPMSLRAIQSPASTAAVQDRWGRRRMRTPARRAPVEEAWRLALRFSRKASDAAAGTHIAAGFQLVQQRSCLRVVVVAVGPGQERSRPPPVRRPQPPLPTTRTPPAGSPGRGTRTRHSPRLRSRGGVSRAWCSNAVRAPRCA